LSRRAVVLPRGLVAVRARTAAVAGDPEPAAAPTASAPCSEVSGPAVDLKELQRKAYERGYAHAVEQRGASMEAASSALTEAAEALRAARARDEEELAGFAVRLATTIAEQLVGEVIDQGEHDVNEMVRRVLDAVMPEVDEGTAELHGHPEDLELLPTTLLHGSTALKRHGDPSMDRGSFRVHAGDIEFYSGVEERLSAIRDRLIQETRDGAS